MLQTTVCVTLLQIVENEALFVFGEHAALLFAEELLKFEVGLVAEVEARFASAKKAWFLLSVGRV